MSACKIVTIKAKHKLFKKGEPATAIELVELEEVGNTVITGKDQYEVGDKVLFIQPDYSIPDTPFFSAYHYPDGDASKSRLGSNGRIKAIKFNLSVAEDNNDPVYSYGIIMDADQLIFKHADDEEKIDELLGVTKWNEPEEVSVGGGFTGPADAAPFPEGMYKTDEENINNLWNTLKYPVQLIGTHKVDGSSITVYCKKDKNLDWKSGICSRSQEKKLTYKKVVGMRRPSIIEWFKKYIFRKKLDLRIFNEVESTSEFIVYGKPYLNILERYCKLNNTEIALRGELCGKGLRGSGNKNNPTVKEDPHVKFYAIDNFDVHGRAYRVNEIAFDVLIGVLGFTRCPILFKDTFYSRQEIEAKCQEMFDHFAKSKILIEGVVLKTIDGTWSAKLMNLEYDSKK
jgi:RNA ligase (TIGR02306 family)